MRAGEDACDWRGRGLIGSCVVSASRWEGVGSVAGGIGGSGVCGMLGKIYHLWS